jgi:hypothetical protein
MSEQSNRTLRFRAVVLAGLAVVLVWQVVSTSLVAYLADAAPQVAVILDSTNPTALLNIADNRLNLKPAAQDGEPQGTSVPDRDPGAKADTIQQSAGRIAAFAGSASKVAQNNANLEPSDGPEDTSTPPERSLTSDPTAEENEQTRGWAELALLNDPLNARARRILGQLADGAADEEGAKKLMQAAARGSLRESVALYWLMQKSYERTDYATAIHYADALLRTRPQLINEVMPTLAKMAENTDANGEMKELLAKNPPWRAQFFRVLLSSISDARTPLDLLLSIKDTPTPPTAADLKVYLDFLIKYQFYELAHYAWQQFLPPEQRNSIGFLFNGSFEVASSKMPFDWAIAAGAGVTVDIATRPDQEGERALFIEFGHGRVDFRGVTQFIMLAPGTYQLKGKHKGQIMGRRGLEWRIRCAAEGWAPIGKSVMFTGVTPAWQEFGFEFTVPSEDCRAQHLRLELSARSASEQFVSGSAWFDELEISRAPENEDPT